MSTVDINDLNYNGILKDINLSFSGKRVIGIVGPNGSGKTTLLRHIYQDIKTRAPFSLITRMWLSFLSNHSPVISRY